VELSKRDLKVPFLNLAGSSEDVDWKERLVRTYLFWTPHPWLALRGEYQYERNSRDNQLTDGIRSMNTHRVPLGISFFHPSGLSASVRTTYFNQAGKFELLTGNIRSGNDDFWTVDAGINYRLPQQYGFITVGATNLFDKKFKFFDTDFNNPSIRPNRMFFTRITLALP